MIPTMVREVPESGMEPGQYVCRNSPKVAATWRKSTARCPYCEGLRLVTDTANPSHSRIIRVLAPRRADGWQAVLCAWIPDDYVLLCCVRCKSWFTMGKVDAFA